MKKPLPRMIVEKYLTERGRTATSLLAAWTESHDDALLEEAATTFPDDPAVQTAILGANKYPGQRADRLQRLAASVPEIALPDYLLAQADLAAGRTDSALARLQQAGKKTEFSAYTKELLAEREILEAMAFDDPAEASLRAIVNLPVDFITPILKNAQGLQTAEKAALARGDLVAALEYARSGLQMAGLVNSQDIPRVLIIDLISMASEKLALSEIARIPNIASALGVDPNARLAEIEEERAGMKGLSDTITTGLNRSSNLLPEYVYRLRNNGELDAALWLRARTAPTK